MAARTLFEGACDPVSHALVRLSRSESSFSLVVVKSISIIWTYTERRGATPPIPPPPLPWGGDFRGPTCPHRERRNFVSSMSDPRIGVCVSNSLRAGVCVRPFFLAVHQLVRGTGKHKGGPFTPVLFTVFPRVVLRLAAVTSCSPSVRGDFNPRVP